MKTFDFSLIVNGQPIRYTLAEREGGVGSDAALVLVISMTRAQSLFERPCCITTERVIAAGCRVLTFDLPHHGERTNRYEAASLKGMCEAVMDGEDPFIGFVNEGKAAIDECIARQWARPGRIFVSGVSRAGYCALRLAAAEKRIKAVAALAPVTDWRVLEECSAYRNDRRIEALSIENYVDPLIDRGLFVAIGSNDVRVGTDRCAQFINLFIQRQWSRAGTAEATLAPSSFHLDFGSEGHSLREVWYEQSADFFLSSL